MAANASNMLRRVLLVLTLAAVCAAGVIGWRWTSGIVCTRVDVRGLHHAEREAVLDLARVDTGVVLFDVDPRLVADRVRRHPWVAEAGVRRLPTGTLSIDVVERSPLVLVVDPLGRPAAYLDAEGYALPITNRGAYNVPLLRGLDAVLHPVRPVQDRTVRALLEALSDQEASLLVSDVEIRSGVDLWVRTVPAMDERSLSVRLGSPPYDAKLERLNAFWEQAVLTQPQKTFRTIDLRFDSQIVTREAPHEVR